VGLLNRSIAAWRRPVQQEPEHPYLLSAAKNRELHDPDSVTSIGAERSVAAPA